MYNAFLVEVYSSLLK